ncbi:spore germination protein KC [Lysinibacillus composti]|uniref:Ger(X)C family spore germination protein n=1 Tax=Lysinibacillus composti TaxID=720633 RepID=A0A3N9UF52_9BACI|nr:Ger(x)C family spore germination protein [Lysinibacillus composti]MBM7608480.1 spore germination protein KC [Lysinibacillus composti]RQW74771.1 Ger(x)C family spore germination protein [Lysinibacillus composti]
MKKCIFGLLILSLLLSGCWDRRELNQLAITLAIGIDKVEDEYQVSAQVVVPSVVSTTSTGGGTMVTLYSARGETIYEAFRKMTKDSPRKIYPGHTRMLVVGEELAKEGIAESLDLVSRDSELRPDFYVVVAKENTAVNILNVTTPVENIPANKMFNSLKMSDNAWSGTKSIKLDELIEDLVSEGKEAVLTGVEIAGNQEQGSSKQNTESISPSARIRYDNLAVFKGDQLVGWLTEYETIGFSYITDSVQTSVKAISCPNEGKATIEVIQAKSELKGKIKNGKPVVNIKLNVEGDVGSVECKMNLNELKTIHSLEKIYEKEMQDNIKKTIATLQTNYKSDIFGFGEEIHRSNPKEWNTIKNNWEEQFSNLTTNVDVDLKILGTGTIKNSLLEKIKD